MGPFSIVVKIRDAGVTFQDIIGIFKEIGVDIEEFIHILIN